MNFAMSALDFDVLDAGVPAQHAKWLALWESWPGCEVFAHPNYVRLYACPSTRAMCATLISPDCCVLLPFLLRDVASEAFWGPVGEAAADMITPYGYGGPFVSGSGDLAAIAASFWDNWKDWAGHHSVVCEFLRLSLFQDTLLPYPGECEEKGFNVVRTLTPAPETLWMDFEHKVRKNVNKARRCRVTVETDPTANRLDEFLLLYQDTMRRREAKESYYFPKEYFKRLSEDLLGQFVFFHAIWQGRIVSTELVLVSADNIYSFLGGTDASAFDVRPNDLLKYEVILWGKKNGKVRFVMGGGYQPNDGIYRYKLSFAPAGVVPFLVAHRVLRPELYHELIEARRTYESRRGRYWEPRSGFFPAYREPIPAPAPQRESVILDSRVANLRPSQASGVQSNSAKDGLNGG